MPQKYRVKAPDGAVYEITAPDGATEQDAIAYVQSNHASLKSLPVKGQGRPITSDQGFNSKPRRALGRRQELPSQPISDPPPPPPPEHMLRQSPPAKSAARPWWKSQQYDPSKWTTPPPLKTKGGWEQVVDDFMKPVNEAVAAYRSLNHIDDAWKEMDRNPTNENAARAIGATKGSDYWARPLLGMGAVMSPVSGVGSAGGGIAHDYLGYKPQVRVNWTDYEKGQFVYEDDPTQTVQQLDRDKVANGRTLAERYPAHWLEPSRYPSQVRDQALEKWDVAAQIGSMALPVPVPAKWASAARVGPGLAAEAEAARAFEGAVPPPRTGAAGGATPRAPAGPPRNPRPEGPSMPRAERRALEMLRQDLHRAGPQVEERLARNPDLTMAEALGQRGMDRLAALGRIEPDTIGRTIQEAMSGRIAQTPNRVNRAFEGATGIAPEEAEAGIDALVATGQKEAKPFYEAAFGQSADSPAMRDLINRVPAVRKGLPPAAEHLLNRGISPSEAVDTLVIPDGFATGSPTGNPEAYLADVREVLTGGARRAQKDLGPSLAEYLAEQGGVRDATGDLMAFDAHKMKLNPGVGKLKKLARPDGMSLHDAKVKAWEAGFFPDIPDDAVFLERLSREAAGMRSQSFANSSDPGRVRYLEGLEQRIAQLGLPPDAKPQDIARRLADEDAYIQHLSNFAEGKLEGFTPASGPERVPTFQHLDMVKRQIDGRLRQAVEVGDKEAIISLTQAKNALVNELKGMSSEYGQALDVSGDYLSAQAAFREAPRRFSAPGQTNYGYEQYIQGLTPQQRRAHLAGVGSDINRRMFSHEGGPGALDFAASPNAQSRFMTAAGPEEGARLHGEIQNALELRRNAQNISRASIPRRTGRVEEEALRALGVTDLKAIPTSRRDLFRMSANFTVDLAENLIRRMQLGWRRPDLEAYAKGLMSSARVTIKDIEALPPSGIKTFVMNMLRGGSWVSPSGN